ncbi:MAG: DNA polymerase III subunit gamma/tau [Clostridia bacterium]|nr:DNA polymerase III subunit gamma/tau [Clostridia bacterium]
MAHLALYRRYRPQFFSEVIGQDHITTILLHQIQQKQPSHAYLFCGPRGTGKTSAAKIFSRAVNCLSPRDGEPCQTCDNCRASFRDNGDIIEIDAASNNGVDNVRDLIDQAQFLPLAQKYRVFIIDEVHMLSASAFNALLKTLEEPPAHVVFILATTEPHKLPATIISRCQRFDFRRLSVAHIIACLDGVQKQLGVSVEPEGLQLIARAADGGMRDALSLLDQCLSFCGEKVTAHDVYEVLGSVEQDSLFELADALLSGGARACVECVGEVVNKGRDLTVFVNDLSGHLRALMLAKSCGDCPELLDCTPDRMARYQKQAEKFDAALILYAMERLVNVQAQLRYFPAPRTLVETALVRICRPQDDKALEALEARLAALEARKIEPPKFEPTPSIKVEAPQKETVEADIVPDPAPEPVFEEDDEEFEEDGESLEQNVTAEGTKRRPSADGDSRTLWNEVLSDLQKINPMLHYSAKNGTARALSDNVLIIEFPMGKEPACNILKAAKNYKTVQDILSQHRPGLELLYRVEPPSDELSELQDLFGSKLIID